MSQVTGKEREEGTPHREASGKPGSGGVGWMEPVATVMRICPPWLVLEKAGNLCLVSDPLFTHHLSEPETPVKG